MKKKNIIIGSVGNIKPAKGYDVLLRAVKLVVSQEKKCRFIIAGETSDRYFKELLELRDKLELREHVSFLGYQENIKSIYRMMDVFVLPSISEGFSLSTIEAMSFGIPVVVTKSGGPEEIVIDDHSGLLAEVKNEKELAKSILRLVYDIGLRKKLGKNGRDTVMERFDIKMMVKSYQEVYDSELAKK